MTWVHQVVHVLRKDLLMSRWYALALAASVTTLTRLAIERGKEFDGTWSFFVVLVATVGICLAVQADSPIETRAFWASRPVSPSAVATAKIFDILLIVVAVRVFAAIAWMVSDPPAPRLPPLITSSPWLLAGIVAGSAMLAAVTADLRTFLVASVVVSVVLMITLSLSFLHFRPFQDVRDIFEVFFGVATVGSVFVVYHAYRTRSRVTAAFSALIVAFIAQLATIAYAIGSRPGS